MSWNASNGLVDGGSSGVPMMGMWASDFTVTRDIREVCSGELTSFLRFNSQGIIQADSDDILISIVPKDCRHLNVFARG